ncbi:MAG: cytochrome P450 [Gaiellaceae bacterium]
MSNAEKTSQGGVAVAPNGNGSSAPQAATSRSAPPLPPVVGNISIRPGRDALSALPPGPRMPSTLQALALWYRRNAWFERCRARYGSRFTIWYRFPAVPWVIISDPEEVKQLFLTPGDVVYCSNGSSELVKYFGDTGLSLSEEDRHLARRKVVNKCTHGEAVARITDTIADVTRREVESWPNDEVISLYWRLNRLTLSVIRQVCFGPEEDERLDELVDVLDQTMRFNDHPLSLLETQFFWPSAVRLLKAVRPLGFRRFAEGHARVNELIYEVIKDRLRSDGGGQDLLSMLLATTNEDGSPLSPLELRDEIMTTFIAGTTTTTSSIAAGVDLITRTPAVRDRIVSAIDAGEDDAYLTATAHEILRRKPPLPVIIPRLVMRTVEIGGIVYQPGIRLWVSSHLVHHDAATYPDPYAFRPERFLDNPPGTYTWVPFGGGRRRCLGKAIAELEIKCVLRQIFGQYDVRREGPEAEATRSNIVTVRPARGTRVALSARS